MSITANTDGAPFQQSLSKLKSGFPLSKIGYVENVSINSKEIENKKNIAKFLQQFGAFETNQIETRFESSSVSHSVPKCKKTYKNTLNFSVVLVWSINHVFIVIVHFSNKTLASGA